MKSIEVVAGIICYGAPHSADATKDCKRFFATQRGYGEQKGGWEFPGGKMEPGETPQQALAHELKASRWLTPAELHSVNWLPADIKVVKALENHLSNASPNTL